MQLKALTLAALCTSLAAATPLNLERAAKDIWTVTKFTEHTGATKSVYSFTVTGPAQNPVPAFNATCSGSFPPAKDTVCKNSNSNSKVSVSSQLTGDSAGQTISVQVFYTTAQHCSYTYNGTAEYPYDTGFPKTFKITDIVAMAIC